MLPAPELDDRRFQDLVDDAKRMVQQRCPEWTDHNVSDPGVTLIETFAFMVDQLLYRLNRVPDRHYVKFLDLIGIRLVPPTAARAPVTFWLSAGQPDTVVVAPGTEVATRRSEFDEAVVFRTVEELAMVPCSRTKVLTKPASGDAVDRTDLLDAGQSFHSFADQPAAEDTLLVGLSSAVPRCAVALRIGARVEGAGVDPRDPPLAWEAWTGQGWTACEVDHDSTGGLNKDGEVVLHVPPEHVESVQARQRAGWLRCRMVEPRPGQRGYTASPRILRLTAATVGGTVPAVHAEQIDEEVLGQSDGLPGQRFELTRRPVVPSDEPVVLEVGGEDGWQPWEEVDFFSDSGPDDTHFLVDRVAGEVQLGPAVRQRDGSLRRYGAAPPQGAGLRMRAYRTGGGTRGNVAARTISVLKSSIPYVARVENRRPASGGVEGETIDEAKRRAPVHLRTGNRAVTAEDYESLAKVAAPEVARVKCVPVGGDDGTAVRVLVVPAVGDGEDGALAFEHLIPADDTLERIDRHLSERRMIGARVAIEPPNYQGFTVVARLRGRPGARLEPVRAGALAALHLRFHPVRGGADGRGWPFGRPVQAGDVYTALQAVDGVELIEDVRLFAADPVSGQRGQQVERVEVGPTDLVFSYEHQVQVQVQA